MKDFLAGFFSTLIGAGVIMLATFNPAHAMSDEEYVQAVGKEFRHAWDSPSRFYGHVEVKVLVTDSGAVLYRASKNETFNAEVLRAANAALDKTVAPGLVFPISFNRTIPAYNNKLPMGGDEDAQ